MQNARRAFVLDYIGALLPVVQALHVHVRTDIPGGLLTRRAYRKLSENCGEFYTLLCGLISMVELGTDENARSETAPYQNAGAALDTSGGQLPALVEVCRGAGDGRGDCAGVAGGAP